MRARFSFTLLRIVVIFWFKLSIARRCNVCRCSTYKYEHINRIGLQEKGEKRVSKCKCHSRSNAQQSSLTKQPAVCRCMCIRIAIDCIHLFFLYFFPHFVLFSSKIVVVTQLLYALALRLANFIFIDEVSSKA